MSKAFTRETDDNPERPPIKSTSALPFGVKNYFTRQGLNRVCQEFQKLNAPPVPPAGRQRIFELERILSSAVVVEPPPKPWHQVSFGATIKVRDMENIQHTYRIVGMDETDLDGNCISWLSPIAKALIKKRLGDQVRFVTPDGEQVLKIIDITFEN